MRARLPGRIVSTAGALLFCALVIWCIKTLIDPGVPTVTVIAASVPDAVTAERSDDPIVEATWTLAGQTRTRQAAPVADVHIEIGRLRAVSADDGTFTIEGVPTGIHRAQFWKEGYRPETRTVARGSALDVRMRRRVDVTGRVLLPGGGGAAGVTVHVFEPDDTETVVTTDADGRFVARGIGEGRARFVVDPHAGKAGAFIGTTGLTDGGGEDVLLPVSAGRAVTGIVTDPEGRPYEGAECHASCYYQQQTKIMARATSDAEGRFTLVVPPEAKTSVIVETPTDGEGFRYTRWGASGVERQDSELDVRLRHGVEISGRIVAPRGVDICGRKILAVLIVGNSSRIRASATVREDGTFRLGGLWPGRVYALRLEGAWRNDDRYVLDGGYRLSVPATDLELRLALGRPFGGRILDASGQPLVSRMVLVQKERVGFRQRTMTGADGRFELARTPPGELSVLVVNEGRNQGVTACGTYRAGDTAVEIRLPD